MRIILVSMAFDLDFSHFVLNLSNYEYFKTLTIHKLYMTKSLLFIPDISGFTQFVQSTEVEHSQHVISELLEILIEANTENLELAEIEGDALFFYKENDIPSQDKLLALVEKMYTAFYSHLKVLGNNRICPCNACAKAPNLQLKIVAHCGDLQFIKVQGKRKPFGEAVIEAHRLLKNSVDSDNYFLLSKCIADLVKVRQDLNSELYNFNSGNDNYDGRNIEYLYAKIDVSKLQLLPYEIPKKVKMNKEPNLVFEKEFPVSTEALLEHITNYKFRHLWADGVEEFKYKHNEVTRLGSEHVCVIGGKQLEFTTVTKEGNPDEIIYGELTKSPSPLDELYQFYIIKSLGKNKSHLKLELFWFANNPIKTLLVKLFAKKQFKKSINSALNKLHSFLKNN